MRNLSIVVAAASLFAGGIAHADELLLTSSNGKSGSSAAIDFVSTNAETVGLEFHITVPAGGEVDLSRFAKNLPKGFTVQSNVVKGKLIAVIFNNQNGAFPAGVHSLGVVSSKGGSSDFAIDTVYASNAKADAVAVKATATDANK